MCTAKHAYDIGSKRTSRALEVVGKPKEPACEDSFM